MAIPKTRTASTDELDELSADDISLRQYRLDVIDKILDSRDQYTDREWAIVSLFYKCGESKRSIARMLRCSSGTVSYYLERARSRAQS